MITQLYINTYQGLGDFLRTCMLNYCFFKKIGRDYQVNFKGSILENCFIDKEIEKDEEIILSMVGHKEPIDMIKVMNLEREDIINFRNSLYSQLKPEIKNKIEELDYDICIHCRVGDHFFLDKSMNPNIRHTNINDLVRAIIKIKNLETNKNKKIRLFSDCKELKDLIKKTTKGISTSDINPTHTAFSKGDNSNAVIEFFQMGRSKKIYSFISKNGTTSMFSFLSAFLYDIPIEAVYFNYDNDKTTVLNSVIEHTYPEKIFQSDQYF